mmetsp:Transcript_22334/g.34579  ORF Transcript_22334/g.34579 Transcript_22334/m.34579 type:complete len:133 (-) Transcript_22334:194-592(-)
MIFKKYQDKSQRFTMDSARKMLFPVVETVPAKALHEVILPMIRRCFIYSKMTNLYDLTNGKAYFHLVYVEFLEFLARFSIIFWSTGPESDGTCSAVGTTQQTLQTDPDQRASQEESFKNSDLRHSIGSLETI